MTEKLKKVLRELREELTVIKQQRSQTDQKFRELERGLRNHEANCEQSNKVHGDRLYFRITALDVHSQFRSITERRMTQSVCPDDLEMYENDIRDELIRLELKGEQESEVVFFFQHLLFRAWNVLISSMVVYIKSCW